MMLFSYALLCFVLASTASAAGPANPGPVIAYGTLHNMVATGTKRPAYDPAKLTKIEDLKPKLEEGHVYSVCRRVAGLLYNPEDNVLVAYIGPVPGFPAIAFVLVFEHLALGLPQQYQPRRVKTLFGKNGPIPQALSQERVVGVNFRWAQVAVAQKIEPYTGGENVKLTAEMLTKIRSNMETDYEKRCNGKPNWEWDWDLMSLGQPLVESLVTMQWRLPNYQFPDQNRRPDRNSRAKNRPLDDNQHTENRPASKPPVHDPHASSHRVGVLANPDPTAREIMPLRKPYNRENLKTVKVCELKEGLVYFVRRRAINLTYSKGDVPVVFLGPVPGAEMIAFVLVLETVDLLPKIYGAEKVNELFSSEKVPVHLKGIDEVGVNFEWAQVVIAQSMKRDKRDEHTGGGEMTDSEKLAEIKSKIGDNYRERRSEWNWDWNYLDLGQYKYALPPEKKEEKKVA